MSYKDKLIKETETLRFYETDKKDKKEIKELKHHSFKIDIQTGLPTKNKKESLALMGFNIGYKKINGKKEVAIGWKFKHENKNILLYLNPSLPKEEQNDIKRIYSIAGLMGYNVTDFIKETLPSIKAEFEILKNKK